MMATQLQVVSSTESQGNSHFPLSTAQLGEGLRRVGKRSLTQRDREAVQSSPCSQGGNSRTGVASSLSPQSAAASVISPDSSRAGPSPAESRSNGAADALSSAANNSPEQLSPLTDVSCLRNAFLPSEEVFVPNLRVVALENREGLLYYKDKMCASPFASISFVAYGQVDALFIALGSGDDNAFCIVRYHTAATRDVNSAPFLPEWLQQWLCDKSRLCISSDAKNLISFILRDGVDPCCSFIEPGIGHWILDPDDKRAFTIMELCREYDVLVRSSEQPHLVGAEEALGGLRSKAAELWRSVFLTLPLMACVLRLLEDQELSYSFLRVEMPIALVLAWMEHVGIACDFYDPQRVHSGILYKLSAIEEHVCEVVGRRVSLTSAEDVGRALFEDLALPCPQGITFKRKNNGKIAYKTPMETLRKLEQHPIVPLILEHRHLTHAVRRIESLVRAVEEPRSDPRCIQCLARHATSAQVTPNSLPQASHTLTSNSRPDDQGVKRQLRRVRTSFEQTATATGRLATTPGSVPLLSLENAFEIYAVRRPSVHAELLAGRCPEPGTRVFLANASAPPPAPLEMRDGILQSVQAVSCAEPFQGVRDGVGGDVSMSLAEYWVRHGWADYAAPARAQSVRQVRVLVGGVTELSFPADQVWRLAAPVAVADDTPMLSVNPRKLLVAEAGWELLSVDYSQLEVRLMAHFSMDPGLVSILRRGDDVFLHIASRWLQKHEDEITAEERSGAKRICYGLVYGVGPQRLADDLGISVSQAMDFQASFAKQFPVLNAWVSSCQETTRREGCIETLYGRRRFLPDIGARSTAARQHAERQAVNTKCQASAADLVKLAMVRIHENLRNMREHTENGTCCMVAHLLLQMHDELLFEVRKDKMDDVRTMVVSEMIKVGSCLNVPLQVRWKVGPTWGSLTQGLH